MNSTSAAVPPPASAAAEVFLLRPMRAADTAFVMDSWLRSAWHVEERKLTAALKTSGASWTQRQRQIRKAKRSWMEAVGPHARALVVAVGTTVAIVCDREDESHIAGWVAFREGRELRSHVKHAYRARWGVEDLLRAAMQGAP